MNVLVEHANKRLEGHLPVLNPKSDVGKEWDPLNDKNQNGARFGHEIDKHPFN